MTALAELDMVAVVNDPPEKMKHVDGRGDPFTDVDRRTIANLSIPRNVYDLQHRLRTDVHTPTRSEQNVYAHLLELEDRGLATNLGEHTDMAKLAAYVERHPTALTMPDDKADIFARRMTHPTRRWRVEGDVWMLTNEGLDTIKAPPLNAPGPMTPSQTAAAIEHEFARVMWDYDPNKASPMAMHPSVYAQWISQVIPTCERIWGERPPGCAKYTPIAGGASGWTDIYEASILNQEIQKTQMPALIDPWFLPLSILAYTDADTGATHGDGSHKPTYTGYVAATAPAASFLTATVGTSNNTTAITFAACTASTSTIVAFGNNSVVTDTSGIFRKWGDCASTVISTTQTPAQFAIGAYVTTAD